MCGGDGDGNSCTKRCKAIFLAAWSMANGLCYLIYGIHSINAFSYLLFMGYNYQICIMVTSCFSIVGGILMLVAILKDIKWLHLVGLIISWLLPVVVFLLVYPLVIHIVFTVCVCQYYKEMK